MPGLKKGLRRISAQQARIFAQTALDDLSPHITKDIQYEPTHILPCYCSHRAGFKRGQCVSCGMFEAQLRDQVNIHLEYVSYGET